MDDLPDALLIEIFAYLPSKAFLPLAHVSNRFLYAWRAQAMVTKRTTSRIRRGHAAIIEEQERHQVETPYGETNPLQVGNLFQTHWNKPSKLRTNLLQYYVSCGWNLPSYYQRTVAAAAARGDIHGMKFLFDQGWCQPDDVDYCTVAGAAGHLEALKWLRESQQCPWDPVEVMQEAYHNHRCAVIAYVELNSAAGCDVRSVMSFR